MKSMVLLLCILCPYHILWAKNTNYAWELVKSENGIKIYTRKMTGYILKEFKGRIYLETSVQKMVHVLKDVQAFPKWMPTVKFAKVLEKKANEQTHYIENKTPWPLSNRDGVYHFTFQKKRKNSTNYIMIKVKTRPDYMPTQEGVVRITKADGSWTFWPQGKGVVVTYQMHADPGGSIPKWLVNRAVIDTPYDTLAQLRDYLKKQ